MGSNLGLIVYFVYEAFSISTAITRLKPTPFIEHFVAAQTQNDKRKYFCVYFHYKFPIDQSGFRDNTEFTKV